MLAVCPLSAEKLPELLPTSAVPLTPKPLPVLPNHVPKSRPVAVSAVPPTYDPPNEVKLNEPLIGSAYAVAADAIVSAAVKKSFLIMVNLLGLSNAEIWNPGLNGITQ